MKRFSVLALLFVFIASTAHGAATLSSDYSAKILKSATAGVNHTTTDPNDAFALGKAADYGLKRSGSFQVVWASLTGTVNATVAINSSVDCVNYKPKLDASSNPISVTLSGASGSSIISINGLITEPCYQAVYTAGTVTGGTVSIFAYGK